MYNIFCTNDVYRTLHEHIIKLSKKIEQLNLTFTNCSCNEIEMGG